MKDFYALIPIETLRHFLNAEILLGESKSPSVEGHSKDATLVPGNFKDEKTFDGIEPVVKESSVSCLSEANKTSK
jgi:hypothetical protein